MFRVVPKDIKEEIVVKVVPAISQEAKKEAEAAAAAEAAKVAEGEPKPPESPAPDNAP